MYSSLIGSPTSWSKLIPAPALQVEIHTSISTVGIAYTARLKINSSAGSNFLSSLVVAVGLSLGSQKPTDQNV